MKKKSRFSPLVSIIINCHNASKYISESIESVIRQTYKNWELIIYDNYSKDKTSLIVKKFIKDNRIKYFKTKSFFNLYHARNLAIKKCKGELIAFLDADDWWKNEKLEKQVSFLSKKKNINIIYSNLYLFNTRKEKNLIFSKGNLYNGNITQKLLDDFKMPILTCLIRKKLFKKYKFDNRYNIIGDFDLFIRFSLKEKIYSIQNPLAYYRMHSSNLSTRRIDLNIYELENWIRENKPKKEFKKFNFSKIKEKIKILKIKNYVIGGFTLKAFKEILSNPVKISNLKFFPFILIPSIITKKILLQ